MVWKHLDEFTRFVINVRSLDNNIKVYNMAEFARLAIKMDTLKKENTQYTFSLLAKALPMT